MAVKPYYVYGMVARDGVVKYSEPYEAFDSTVAVDLQYLHPIEDTGKYGHGWIRAGELRYKTITEEE